MIRAAGFVATGMIAAAVCAGCSSSGSGSSTTAAAPTAPSEPPTTGVPADGATISAIDKAYATFFAGTSTLAQSQAALQHGDKFTATLRAQGKSAYAQQSSATVDSVVMISPNAAAVTFTIKSGGSVLLSKTPGYAARAGGTWQVAARTFCGLFKLQGDAPDACDDPAVTALPH